MKKPTKSASTAPKPLNDKERAFVEYYIASADLNATQAAIKAGYASSTAHAKAWSWVGKSRNDCPRNKQHVWDAVKAAIEERAERNKIDADYVLQKLVAEVEADLADLLDENNNLLPVRSWPLVWRQGLVSGLDTDELFAGSGKDREQIGVTHKVKLSDRAQRLVTLGRHINVQAFKDVSEVEGRFSVENFVLEKARKRETTNG